MTPVANLFADIPLDLPQEQIDELAASPNVRIERIVSRGHASRTASGTTRTGTNG